MNNYINFYYNLYPETIREQNKQFYFYLYSEKYYFIVFNRPVEDASLLYELNAEMIRKGSLVHEIVLNKDRQSLTVVNNVPYILMKVYVNEQRQSNLNELVFLNINNSGIKRKSILDRNDWPKLWSAKIDYFEYQISQIGKKFPIVCEYLGYYIGLAENAISYVKNTFADLKPSSYDGMAVSHKRITDHDTLFDIYNPITFVVDYMIRDLSEYIKSKVIFTDDNTVFDELDDYFKNYALSPFSKRLLYGRILFPSYFFDVYEDIVDGKIKEEDIMNVISKAEMYEQFLQKIYAYLNNDNSMPPIDWLNKKNSFI